MVEKMMVAGALLILVSYLGLLFRPNPREAPTWTVVGLAAGLLLSVGGAVAGLLIRILL
jgi:hypothetical protein